MWSKVTFIKNPRDTIKQRWLGCQEWSYLAAALLGSVFLGSLCPLSGSSSSSSSSSSLSSPAATDSFRPCFLRSWLGATSRSAGKNSFLRRKHRSKCQCSTSCQKPHLVELFSQPTWWTWAVGGSTLESVAPPARGTGPWCATAGCESWGSPSFPLGRRPASVAPETAAPHRHSQWVRNLARAQQPKTLHRLLAVLFLERKVRSQA